MIALLYIPFCIWFGYINAQWVEKKVNWEAGKKIKHFFNGVIHIGVAIGVWLLCKYANLPKWLDDNKWEAAICVLCVARVVFTTAYNYFHIPRQPIDYVTSTPKAITDKLEQLIFKKNGIMPLVLATAILIILLTHR